MKRGCGVMIGIGVISLALSVLSRIMNYPFIGIESHAMAVFAQACFLLAIALALCCGSCESHNR